MTSAQYVWKQHTAQIAISQDLLNDRGSKVTDFIKELLVYGQPLKHSNPLPEFVLFPRLKRLTDGLGELRKRFSFAADALRYGVPDREEEW